MKELKRASLIFALFFVVTGLAYPLFISGLSRLLFPAQAGGSLIIDKGIVVGSALIGQRFTSPGYFHGRPWAIDYDASNSGGTNFGPDNGKLLAEVANRIRKTRAENNMGRAEPVPQTSCSRRQAGSILISAWMRPSCRFRGSPGRETCRRRT